MMNLTLKKFLSSLSIKNLFIYLLLGLFILLHLFLVFKTFVYDSESIRTAYAGFGDIPFHMTQVSNFGFTGLFNLNETLFAGETIKYPFIINWISGLFLKITGSWSFSFHFPTMALLVLSYVLIFLTYKNILTKRWAALLAVIVFMLGSGLGGWSHAISNWFPDILNVGNFINYLVENNVSTSVRWESVYPSQGIAWGSVMSLFFLHQRAFFVGLFLFSVVVFALSQYPNMDNKKWRWLAGIAFGLGPLGHSHTFVVLGLILGLYFLIALIKKNRKLVKNLFFVFLIASIVAIPQIIYLSSGQNFFGGSSSNGLITFRLGWMTEPGGFGSVNFPKDVDTGAFSKFLIYLKFLWLNFGFILPLLILSFFSKHLRLGKGKLPVLWFATLLFVFAQTVKTQPWDFDTNKIFVYFAFFASGAIIYFLLEIRGKLKTFGTFILIASFILIIFSGVIDILPKTFVPIKAMPVIFNSDSIKTANFIRQNIEPEDVFLSTTTHLNPVSSLSGRPTVEGFPGWLYTKGIDCYPREQDLKKFFANPKENLNIASKYKAKYVLFDPTAMYDWKANKILFDNSLKLIFSSGDYFIYSIN